MLYTPVALEAEAKLSQSWVSTVAVPSRTVAPSHSVITNGLAVCYLATTARTVCRHDMCVCPHMIVISKARVVHVSTRLAMSITSIRCHHPIRNINPAVPCHLDGSLTPMLSTMLIPKPNRRRWSHFLLPPFALAPLAVSILDRTPRSLVRHSIFPSFVIISHVLVTAGPRERSIMLFRVHVPSGPVGT